jgi:transposase
LAEGLSDRQAADDVRTRVDGKYMLSLELTDPGFDASVLSELGAHLLTDAAESLLFDTLLQRCRDRHRVQARGHQFWDH